MTPDPDTAARDGIEHLGLAERTAGYRLGDAFPSANSRWG